MFRRLLIILSIIAILAPQIAFSQTRPSASLFFSLPSGTFAVNENFNIGVRISSPAESSNAAQGTIFFSPNILEVVRISHSGSIFTLWPQEPTFSNRDGTVSFAGGLPNPGFKGESALIFIVTFKGEQQGAANVSFSSGTVLANDGFGTDITKILGSGRYTIAPPEIRPPAPPPAPPALPPAPTIYSPTHPEPSKWYANREVEFRWDLPKGVTDVSFLFNQYEKGAAGKISDGLFASKKLTAISDGIWYFHIRFKNRAGWGEVSHFKTQIDTEPPLPFSIFIKEDTKITEPQPTLIFEASDATSGIDYYEISIDEGRPIIWQKTDKESTFKIPEKLRAGKHTIKVRAFDFAGNFQIAEKELEIIEVGPPIIEFITNKLWGRDPIVAQGTAPPKSNIIIKITDEKTKIETKHDVETDERGQWFFVFRKGLPKGKYTLRAALVTPEGIQSPFSEPLMIVILRPIVFYAWTASTIVLLIIAITLLILMLYYRKKLKKKHRR